MRVARAFSTSLRHTRQALYEPYVPPLNQEQKKALRKLIIASMPNIHSRFNQDADKMLRTYSVSDSTLKKRRNTLQRVRELIQSAFGPDYSVMDRSLSQYSRDVEYIPLELTITDDSRPTGFPPDKLAPRLPDAYNHEALAMLLQRNGYSGCFVAGDAVRNQPRVDPGTASRPTGVPGRGPYPTTHPWPTYTPCPTVYLTYPPVLWVESAPNSSDTMSFFLSPPVATHAPLLRLLKAYTSKNDHFRDLITIIFLWTRSINLAEITPTCVAFMVIGWLQHREFVPVLQNPSSKEDMKILAEKDDGVWFNGASPTRGHTEPMFSSTWLETGFIIPGVHKRPKKLSVMLHDFFSFWSLRSEDSAFISSKQYISIRDGAVVPRERRVAKNVRFVLEQDNLDIARGLIPPLNAEPTMWQTQPIVVQDPFVPSFNHAHTVSKVAGTYFHYWCSLSQRTMSRSHPMTMIFGPSLPRLTHLNVRRFSTASVLQEIDQMYKTTIPQSVFDSRQRIVSRVEKAVINKFGNAYKVECFGSTRYDVSTPTSDLDLVIIDKKNINGFPRRVNVKRLPAVYNVWMVARALMKNGFVDVVVIAKAKVPIVKFRDPMSNLYCDLNVNEQLGLWNTKLIAQYCDLAPELIRPLIVFIKRWAKSHGLNDASGASGPATFSSYSLVLMIIGYLQLRGALPSLQAELEPLPDNAKQGVFWLRSDDREGERCDIRFKSGHDWTPQVQLSVEEALLGWFTFWAREYRCEEHILSIRDGHLIKRRKEEKKKEIRTTSVMMSFENKQLKKEADDEAALAAFAEQSESNEGSHDVAENEDREAKGYISDTSTDLEREQSGDADNNTEPSERGGVLFGERQKGKTQMVADFLGEERDQIGPGSEAHEPTKWRHDRLIVVDPFILSKNVCGNIGKTIARRFHAECQRCVELLEWGADLESLMGDKDPSLQSAQRRGGKRLQGKMRGGRTVGGAESVRSDGDSEPRSKRDGREGGKGGDGHKER